VGIGAFGTARKCFLFFCWREYVVPTDTLPNFCGPPEETGRRPEPRSWNMKGSVKLEGDGGWVTGGSELVRITYYFT